MLIPERRRVILEEGIYRLPFGELSVHIDPDEFRYGPFRMVNFVDAAEFEVRGLRNTYRSAHIDGVASELIVHSGRSAQESLVAIEELRRILAENLKD
jgi:hypothetical protein